MLLLERKSFELLHAGGTGMLYEKGAIGSGKNANANAKTRNCFEIGKTLIGS